MQNTTTILTQNITPSAAAEILAANGLTVSEKEGEEVVNFLYTLASSTIPGSNEKSNLIHQG